MATLSPLRLSQVKSLQSPLLHSGKVRDSYRSLFGHRLSVASDGISIFDFVLNALVPEKGYVLNAMSHFWLKRFEAEGIRTHLLAAGANIDPFLPEGDRDEQDTHRRAQLVRDLVMARAEFIARECLTGSVLSGYRKTGMVYGTRLPEAMQDGDELPHTLFTPTSKAEEGHDEPIDANTVRREYGEETNLFLRAHAHMVSHARERGIVMADDKGEIGRDRYGVVRVGDEAGTPDCSRFWDSLIWSASRNATNRKAPPPFDKQLVRAWGIEMGINTLDPLNPEHVKHVQSLVVPDDLIAKTTGIYRYIFWRLVGRTLEAYTRDELEVMVPLRKRRLAVVVGSESDLPTVAPVIASAYANHRVADGINGAPDVHVISCHRNPDILDAFARDRCNGADAVICAGGLSLALPGVLDALLHNKGFSIPVIGVALGDEASASRAAAVSAIRDLPGKPVVMDEMRGKPYEGREGLMQALIRVAHGELPPPVERTKKPPLLHVDLSKYTTA